MKREIKVLTINTTAYSGGAASVAKNIHDYLNSSLLGASSVFISGRGPSGDTIESLRIPKPIEMLNIFLYRLLGKEGLLNIRYWRELLHEHCSKIDVIHLHNVHGYYLPNIILSELLQYPVVWTLHDYWLLTGKCAAPRDCLGYQSGCTPCLNIELYPRTYINVIKREYERKKLLINESAALFVVPSETSRKILIKMGLPENRSLIIENPLATPSENIVTRSKIELRDDFSLPQDKKIFLFVANKIEEKIKGFNLLINALSGISSQLNICLVVVGDASDTVVELSKNIPHQVHFVGKISDRQQLFDYYRSADLFINPSYLETFGLVNMEAISSGCDVICSDLDVFHEIDRGYMNFFKTGDADDLRVNIIKFIDGCISVRCNERISLEVISRFSILKAGHQYYDAYRRVLNR